MKVWQKILVAPAVAIAFLLALGVVSYLMLARQNESLELLANQRMARFEQISSAAADLGEVHSGVYRLITWIGNYDEAKVKTILGQQLKNLDQVAASVARIAASTELAPTERKLLEQVKPLIANYRSGIDKAVDLSTVDVATGLMAMQAADARFLALTKDFDSLVEAERTLANESYQAAAAAFRQTVVALLAIVLVAIVASLLIALAMSRVIVRPLQEAIAAADRIAAGDLTGRVLTTEGRDETAQMLRALRAMADRLRELVGEVATGAKTVATTSDQIAQGNLDLSQRTEEQASTLEETASSMEELTSTVTQNAESARQATQLATEASQVARRGGDVVGEVVSTMDGISQSSKRISEIIGVIDGIAFQTNILALNAAVEAARAGEQGRGFAVVASEVRSLAQRSAAAAKEIKELIVDSVHKVDAGSRMVNNAGRTMEEIVAAVAKVSNLVAEIAAASQEQSSGIEQVNTAVTQMDQAVQQNASLVEEAAAATESMKHQAGSLLQLVSRFKLDGQEAATAPAGEARPRPAAIDMPASIAPIRISRPAARPERVAVAGAGSWREF